MGNLVITNKGRELMAELIAGTSTGTFSRVCTSACDCSGMELEELTGLPDIKQEAAVSKVSRIDTAQVEVLAAINNRGLEEGYYVRGIGLYASGPDGEEILYGVSVESEHPDYMPAFGGRTVSGITYRLNVKVDNSEQITIEVNPAAVSTVEQVEAVQAAVDTHTEGTVCSEDGVHGFRFYNNLPQVYREESKAWIDANAASGNTARTVTKAVYEERLAAYQKDSTYKDPDSGLPFADTLYYVEDDYQDMERQAENIRYTDTCALGSANLQGIIDIIAEKVKTQLLSRSDVADNLLSTAADLPLSANQGSVLNSKIDRLYNMYPRIIITAANGLDVSQAVITASDGSHAYTGRFAGQECVITIMNLEDFYITSSNSDDIIYPQTVVIDKAMQVINCRIYDRSRHIKIAPARIFASNNQTGYTPDKAVNGIIDNDMGWIVVNDCAEATLTAVFDTAPIMVMLAWYGTRMATPSNISERYWRNCYVQGSVDGSSYDTISETVIRTGGLEDIYINLTPGKYKYIRLCFSGANNFYGSSVAEVEFYATV